MPIWIAPSNSGWLSSYAYSPQISPHIITLNQIHLVHVVCIQDQDGWLHSWLVQILHFLPQMQNNINTCMHPSFICPCLVLACIFSCSRKCQELQWCTASIWLIFENNVWWQHVHASGYSWYKGTMLFVTGWAWFPWHWASCWNGTRMCDLGSRQS